MFPTFSSLVNYVFGTDFSWPLPTFGVFVVFAFIFSYLIFRAEFKRKERLHQLKAYKQQVYRGQVAGYLLFLGYGIVGFIIGYKGVGVVIERELFHVNPARYIFSFHGNWISGMLLALIAILISGLIYRKIILSNSAERYILVRPKDLLPFMLLCIAITGFIGAKFFMAFENGQLYHSHSFFEILNFGGLTFWGGLLFGGLTYFFIGLHKGMGWKHLADVGSLGMLLAYAVGRMGCHLSGDGDWGVVNTAKNPFMWLPEWMWSFRFPHNVLGQGEYMMGCQGKYCYILTEGVFPTSFYESVLMLFIFIVLWIWRNKIKIPGLMFIIYLFFAGVERFLIEFIRINFKFDVFGFLLSEAQIVGILMVIFALLLGGYLFVENKKIILKNDA